MRFEISKSTPPHLNRRLQLRMLSFVMMFAAVVFIWNTLQAPAKKKADDGSNTAQPWEMKQIDYTVRDSQSQTLQPEEFIAAAPADLDRMGDPPAEGQPAWQESSPVESDVAMQNDVDREIARRETAFDRGLLRNVKDNTLGIRREEADAYYRLLAHCGNVPLAELERAGSTDVMYINLMTQPDRFRGEPVTIQGDLWRLYEFQAGPNNRGLKTLYEAWIFTADSESHPFRVVFTSLPRELEPGENLRKPVRVTGYFFKREGYPSNGGMHVAPTLLAKQVSFYRPPNMAPPTDDIVPYMIGVISAIGLVFLVTLVSFMIGDRRAAHLARLRDLTAPRPSFDGIAVSHTTTVGESLRLLAEESWHAAANEQTSETPDAAAILRAREQSHRNDAPRTEPAEAPDELPADPPRIGGSALHNWLARQHAATNGSTRDSTRDVPHESERRETQRVLDRLQTATTSEPTAGQSYPLNSDQSAELMMDSEPNTSASTPTTSTNDSESVASGGAGGASKLSAWESEIQQFAAQRSERNGDRSAVLNDVRAEVEHDQAARERALREQLQHRRTELELERQASDEADRLAREQAEWDARQQQADRERQLREQQLIEREQRERDAAEHERRTIDRADRSDEGHTVENATEATNESEVDESLLTEEEQAQRLRKKRGGWGWNWSRRRTPSEDADSSIPPREPTDKSGGDNSTDRREPAENVDPSADDASDEASLTDEQRAELRKRRGRRGGWGWPRRRSG
jgi:hypothetical protein